MLCGKQNMMNKRKCTDLSYNYCIYFNPTIWKRSMKGYKAFFCVKDNQE